MKTKNDTLFQVFLVASLVSFLLAIACNSVAAMDALKGMAFLVGAVNLFLAAVFMFVSINEKRKEKK